MSRILVSLDLETTGLDSLRDAIIEIGVVKFRGDEVLEVVLAGVPMTTEGAHYYSSTPWTQATRYYRGWLKLYDEIAPYVRSMSGWTKTQFGEPTPELLGQVTPERVAYDVAHTG